jgi:hypothetical protein
MDFITQKRSILTCGDTVSQKKLLYLKASETQKISRKYLANLKRAT